MVTVPTNNRREITMDFDKKELRDLLRELNQHFPESAHQAEQAGRRAAMLIYLEGLGLAECSKFTLLGTNDSRVVTAKITPKGRDFISEDGGLSAELDVVVVKLHADTIKALIAAQLELADIPEHERSAIKESLKTASSAALANVTSRLVDAVLGLGPDCRQPMLHS